MWIGKLDTVIQDVREMSGKLDTVIQDVREMSALPTISVDLMHAKTTENDAFFSQVVREFFSDANRRHRKFPLIRNFNFGVALCPLPDSLDSYLSGIEASARRNYKKALRNGYRFERIVFNDHLDDIQEIRRSTDIRQGKVSEKLLISPVKPCADPPTRTTYHDYPYFGVLKGDKLCAYASCLVAGEICLVQHILGHAAFQQDGVVPMLLIGMAGFARSAYPCVKYYAYGTFYGAGTTMRRFKKKFAFKPHRVKWVLG